MFNVSAMPVTSRLGWLRVCPVSGILLRSTFFLVSEQAVVMNQGLSAGTENLASALQQTAANMKKLSGTVKQHAENGGSVGR